MEKNPAFQFYPGDWFREPGLRAASIAAKGAWAQILFSLHDAKERGKLHGDLEYWGNLIGVKPWGEYEAHGSYQCTPWEMDSESNKETALSLIRELVKKEVCDIEFNDDISRAIFFNNFTEGLQKVSQSFTFLNCKITIINRRMYRSFLESEKNRIKQQKHRDRVKETKKHKENNQYVTDGSNPKVTSISSSSSSSSSSKEEQKPCIQMKPDAREIGIFLTHAGKTFFEKTGARFNVSSGKDSVLVKKLLGKYSLKDLLTYWDVYISSQDRRLASTDYTIGAFHANINRVIMLWEKERWRYE